MIVSLELAKDHLRVTGSASDALITRYILQTQAAIFQYLEVDDMDGFYYEHGEGHNYVLEVAALLGVLELYDKRSGEPLTQAVQDTLRRYRLPVVANANDE